LPWPHQLEVWFRTMLDAIHRLMQAMYPVAIYFVSLSWWAMYVSSTDPNPHDSSGLRRVPRVWRSQGMGRLSTFVGLAGAASGVVGLTQGTIAKALTVFGGCLAILIYILRGMWEGVTTDGRWDDARDFRKIHAFLLAMFFGSMWFSWQIEVGNSRN